VSFAFVAFVAVSLLSKTALVWAILALKVVRAGVEERGLVGKLRVEVCLIALPSGGGGSELDEVAAGGASGAVGNAAAEGGGAKPSSGPTG
jgi:hypothetical protein